MGNLKVAGLDIGSHNLTIDESSGTLLVDGAEVSGSGGGGISYVWANKTARLAQTGMSVAEQGVQQDTNTVYKYNGTAWKEYYVMSDSTVQKYYEGTSAPINSKIGDEWFAYNDSTLYKRVSDGADSVWMAMNSLAGGGSGGGGGGGLSIEDKTKLDGIEVGATKNKTDGFLLSRSNHTGTISISVVENLEQELAKIVAITNKLDAKGVEANKVLVSNGDDTSEWKDYNTYSYTESEIAPLNPKLGDDWRDTASGKLYKWSSVGGVAEWSEIGAGSSSGVFNPDNDIMLSAGKGVVMTSGNGTIYKLYIDNDGRLTTEVI